MSVRIPIQSRVESKGVDVESEFDLTLDSGLIPCSSSWVGNRFLLRCPRVMEYSLETAVGREACLTFFKLDCGSAAP